MEDLFVTISRAKGSVTYPAQFNLVAASNPCPCGYFGDPKKACKCLPGQILRYQKRVSGPILDRIDIHVHLSLLETDKLVGTSTSLSIKVDNSKTIQLRVQKARDIQSKRYKGTKFKSNSELSSKAIKEFCQLSPECYAILRSLGASNNLNSFIWGLLPYEFLFFLFLLLNFLFFYPPF